MVAVALTNVDQVVAQRRCDIVLDPKGCSLKSCKDQCLKFFKGNGECVSGSLGGSYQCVCIYNC